MIPALTLPSPLHRLNILSNHWNLDLWAKRDDLIPEFLGGNKVRKVCHILSTIIAKDRVPDLIITNGGAASNHARVVALAGARLGCQVHLVLHGSPVLGNTTSGNAYFFLASGAEVTYVSPEAISATINLIASDARTRGKHVLIIPGGGHSPEAVEAYADAVTELPFVPDIVLHASGTGGTQAGLVTGFARENASTRVLGISVARSARRGIEEISRLLPPDVSQEAILFDDRFRFGGYEQFAPELFDFMREVVRLEGLPLDPTYTGKALFGLERLVKEGDIPRGARVIFWHTGGLLNLQTYHESQLES